MEQNGTIELKRACEAIQIPAGTVRTLEAGTRVEVTQTLGGNYTVHCPDGLFRIAAKDADALGLEAGTSPPPVVAGKGEGSGEAVEEKQVWDTLKTCFDPEIPVNIVDLGLVYDLLIEPMTGGNSLVRVKMTLTAPGCGMGTVIASDARDKLLYLPGVGEASVEIVWDPPWHQSMITADGRRILGLE